MPGSSTFEPASISPQTAPIGVAVFRFFPEAEFEDQAFLYLPNVVCEQVQVRLGADPGVARFRYVINKAIPDLPFPTEFEEILGVRSEPSPYVVQTDDRIVVKGYSFNPESSSGYDEFILFDGFAQNPQLDLGGEQQTITWTAAGVAVRCWDTPIGGRFECGAHDPESGQGIQTDLPTRFNPDAQPNATPAGYDVAEGEATSYPMFLDHKVKRVPDPRRFWTLGMATRYILQRHNAGEDYVKNPPEGGEWIDNFLKAVEPKGGGVLDPEDPSTFTAKAIVVRDFDATNEPWPTAIEKMIRPAGIYPVFRLGGESEPETTLGFVRRDGVAGNGPIDLYLDAAGATHEPAKNNITGMSATRDVRSIANRWEVETAPVQFEASFILAPGFVVDAGDAADSARKAFLRSNQDQADADQRKKYRWYIFDEAGEGHWDFGTSAFIETPGDLFPVIGKNTVRRLRPAVNDGRLISRDGAGKLIGARLDFSRSYSGKAPAVWDRSGNWQPITGGWKLLNDRLGIEVTIEDPNDWPIGEYTGANPQNYGKSLRGVESIASPVAGVTTGPGDGQLNRRRFFLRLTCVIESDFGIQAAADKRSASPTGFGVTRRIESRDHFLAHVRHRSSPYHSGPDELTRIRDDTDKAKAHAEQLRIANELGPFAGSVTIPRFTDAYELGDTIRMIKGRNMSMRLNAGSGAGEAAQYPMVVGITHTFGDRQATVLQLEDLRGEVQRI